MQPGDKSQLHELEHLEKSQPYRRLKMAKEHTDEAKHTKCNLYNLFSLC